MPLKDHLEKLLVFEAVCRCKSFSLAARELGLSQPATFKNIAVLEHALALELISRSRKGVFPTVQGMKLLQASREILAAVGRFDEEMETSQKVMRIGTKEPIAAHLLADFIGTANERNIELMVEPSNSSLIAKLLRGEVKLLVIPESDFPKNLRRTVIFTSRWGAFASPNAKSERLIVFPETLAGSGRLQDYLNIPKDTLKVQSFATALVMASKGLGTAILPVWIARDHLKAGMVVEKILQEVSSIPITKICALRHGKDRAVNDMAKKLRMYMSALSY